MHPSRPEAQLALLVVIHDNSTENWSPYQPIAIQQVLGFWIANSPYTDSPGNTCLGKNISLSMWTFFSLQEPRRRDSSSQHFLKNNSVHVLKSPAFPAAGSLPLHNATRKVKAHLELNLVKIIRANKKGFFRWIMNHQQKDTKQNVGPTAEWEQGPLATEMAEKAEILNGFFSCLFWSLEWHLLSSGPLYFSLHCQGHNISQVEM